MNTKAYTARFIALIVTLCVVALIGLIGVLLYLLPQNYAFVVVGIVVLLGIVGIYFLAQYFINIFIVEKVRPIYKIIRSANGTHFHELVEKKENLIEEAQQDANVWAKKNIDEFEFLKKQEAFRREYIGNVAHELKTPIFTIQGYVSTLLEGGLYDESINRNYLERTDKVIQRMTSIVNDLDAINRLESGDVKMEYTTFNIVDLVNEIFEAQEYIAKERNVRLSIETELPKPLMVYADRKRMSMALSNLIINGINYNKAEGGIVLVRLYDMDTRYLVEVSDTGIGIPKEYQEHIFERFFRVDKSRSREQGGTGLGLAIVKHVIEAHESSISVKSTIGKGTSFSFTIKKGFVR